MDIHESIPKWKLSSTIVNAKKKKKKKKIVIITKRKPKSVMGNNVIVDKLINVKHSEQRHTSRTEADKETTKISQIEIGLFNYTQFQNQE